MSKHLLTVLLTLVITAMPLMAEDKPADAKPAANPVDVAAASLEAPKMTPLQQAAYGIGKNIGQQLKQMGDAIDVKFLISGLTDAMSDLPSKVTAAELQAAFTALDAHMAEKDNAAGAVNEKAGKEFLAANATKEGVKTTASGLQYKITKEGTGKTPVATDTVRVHYKGTLLNGKQFDSSYDRGEPAEFPLNGVIPGWTEGLQLIKEGGKATLWIPSDLAYGPNGNQGIPPSSTLIFEVELLEVK
jgi:FKBP-type peptidyl-prolyl cis-trans isomerase